MTQKAYHNPARPRKRTSAHHTGTSGETPIPL